MPAPPLPVSTSAGGQDFDNDVASERDSAIVFPAQTSRSEPLRRYWNDRDDIACSWYPPLNSSRWHQNVHIQRQQDSIDSDGQHQAIVSDWLARQKQTGATGRLIAYKEGECPVDDFSLSSGDGERIVVSRIIEGGKAFFAGVKVGDVLASINGERNFIGESAFSIYRRLSPPVTLVFLGFVGDLHAEVRLSCHRTPCGMLSLDDVMRRPGESHSTVRVVDEVVFQPTSASLLLTTTNDDHSEAEVSSGHSTRDSITPSNNMLYELHSGEARVLVRSAMLRMGFYNPPDKTTYAPYAPYAPLGKQKKQTQACPVHQHPPIASVLDVTRRTRRCIPS